MASSLVRSVSRGTLLSLTALWAAACSTPPATNDAGDSATTPEASAPEAGTPDATGSDAAVPEAGAPEAGSPDAGPSTIRVRVAHLSPNAPAVDFCVRPMGTTAFTGPVLESRGLAAGLTFSQVTGYVALPPGQWQVRLVAANATNCDTSLAGLPEYTLPNLPAGTWATVAASGRVGDSGATAFDLRPYVDTRGPIAADRMRVRFVHASPGTPPVDVGLVNGAMFTPIWSNTPFGAFTGVMGADANGYATTMPLSMVTLGVRATGTATNALTLSNVSIPAGAQVSVFAIGIAGMTAGDQRLSALVCQDLTDASMGLASCARLPAP